MVSNLRVWGKVSRTAHLRFGVGRTSSFVLLVLREQRMSRFDPCVECAAYLFRVHNDDKFISRLGVGLVDDPGDTFTHGTR